MHYEAEKQHSNAYYMPVLCITCIIIIMSAEGGGKAGSNKDEIR